MSKKLKIYEVDFEAVYPVGNCLILAAYNQEQAESIARETITHTSKIVVTEVVLDKPKVIQYLSGDY
jgi:hypothetical protein